MQLTKKVKHKIGSLTLLFKATSPDYSISVFEMFDVWYGFVEIIPLLKDWSRTRYLFRDVS